MDQSASRMNMGKKKRQQSLSTKVPTPRKGRGHKQHTALAPPARALVRMRQKKGRCDGKLTAILTLNT